MAEDDVLSLFDEEDKEEEQSDATSNVESITTDTDDDDVLSLFDTEEEEPVVEEEVSQTERALTPDSSKEATPLNQLYGKAEDVGYARETYDEGVKTYDEFVKDTKFLGTANEYMLARSLIDSLNIIVT